MKILLALFPRNEIYAISHTKRARAKFFDTQTTPLHTFIAQTHRTRTHIIIIMHYLRKTLLFSTVRRWISPHWAHWNSCNSLIWISKLDTGRKIRACLNDFMILLSEWFIWLFSADNKTILFVCVCRCVLVGLFFSLVEFIVAVTCVSRMASYVIYHIINI